MLTKKKDPKTWNSGTTTGKYLKKEAPSDVPSKKVSNFDLETVLFTS